MLLVGYLFIHIAIIPLFITYSVIMYTLFICMNTFPFLIHSLDDPEFTRPDIGRFLILFMCSLSSYA